MRPPVVLLVVLLAVGAGVALRPRDSGRTPDVCGPVDKLPSESGVNAAGQATICLLNRERTSRGLPPFRLNPLLTQASVEHSGDMVRLGYFEHTSPDGRSVGDRLRSIGYSRGVNASAGENIAYGVGKKATPKAIVAAWMKSTGHRQDILRRTFTEIGIGVALGAPEVNADEQGKAATYTTDFGGVPDPTLPNG